MNAYRIQNDIVAAKDPLAAVAYWAEWYRVPYNSAGQAEAVPLTLEIEIEDEAGNFRTGTLAEAMPASGDEAPFIVAFGEHEGDAPGARI